MPTENEFGQWWGNTTITKTNNKENCKFCNCLTEYRLNSKFALTIIPEPKPLAYCRECINLLQTHYMKGDYNEIK